MGTFNQTSDLLQKKCKPCRGEGQALGAAEAEALLKTVKGWKRSLDGPGIVKKFTFAGYDETLQFVNQVAGIAKAEDHHPDMTFGYKTCEVLFVTHAVKGLSENDFICAAKVNALVSQS